MEGSELTFAPGIEGLDQQVSLWMNSHTGLDSFWAFMSEIKVWIPLYVLTAAFLLWRLGWKRGLLAIACIALAFFCNERINNLVKDLVERVRPCNDPRMIALGLNILETGGGWSFPSGHACNSFGFALCSLLCIREDKRSGWNFLGAALVMWAALVGISRVMVGRHFLGDVLVGTLIGTLMAVAWGRLFRYLCSKSDGKH